MAFEPTNPETVSVPVTTTEPKLINVHIIDNFKVTLEANNLAATTLTVQWSKGYKNDQIFVATETTITTYQGANLLAKLATIVTPNMSYYDNIKAAIWDLMQIEGTLPSGTIV